MKIPRRPLAWGAWEWALPDSELTLYWGGPGEGLHLMTRGHMRPVSHPSAGGTYQTVKENAALTGEGKTGA